MNGITFEKDGTVSPEQLAAMPEDLRTQLADPAFIDHAKRSIRAERYPNTERKVPRMLETPPTKDYRMWRRPPELSGRQRRIYRKLARRYGKVNA